MKINQSAYNVIMLNAVQAFEREGWLMEAGEMRDAGLGESVYEILEGFFAPFCGQLIAQSTDLSPENVGKARTLYFHKFMEMAIPQ